MEQRRPLRAIHGPLEPSRCGPVSRLARSCAVAALARGGLRNRRADVRDPRAMPAGEGSPQLIRRQRSSPRPVRGSGTARRFTRQVHWRFRYSSARRTSSYRAWCSTSYRTRPWVLPRCGVSWVRAARLPPTFGTTPGRWSSCATSGTPPSSSTPKCATSTRVFAFRCASRLALERAFREANLVAVEVVPVDVPTRFRDFDDYWTPFLGGQGPAPAYAMSLDEASRDRLRDRIRKRLPSRSDGSIPLMARAWAVRGKAAA